MVIVCIEACLETALYHYMFNDFSILVLFLIVVLLLKSYFYLLFKQFYYNIYLKTNAFETIP